MRIITILALVLVGCGSSGGSETNTTGSVNDPLAQYDAHVVDQYQRIGPTNVLLIGDSLTWFNPVTELCGLPVVNAGYPGGKWDTVLSRPLVRNMNTKLAIVMLGTNNATRGPDIEKAQATALLSHMQAELLIVETPPYNFISEEMTPENLARLLGIQDMVLDLGLAFIDSRPVMGDPLLYRDGTHWNAQGYAVQNALLESEACKLVRREM